MHETGVRLRNQLFRHCREVTYVRSRGRLGLIRSSYAGGQSEIIMGQAIKKYNWKRNDIVISTKACTESSRKNLTDFDKLNWGGANGEVLVNNHGLSRKHIIEGLEASLERLDLKYVDIVYAHRPDRLTPMEETVRAFNYVIENGMAFYWGTSEWSADEIAEACGIAKELRMVAPIVEQPLYNILDRKKVEGEFQRLYQRFGLGLTTFSPLKMGLLSGKYNDALQGPPSGSRFSESKDKFAEFMRENYGNDEWKSNVAKVAKLKVCLALERGDEAQLTICSQSRRNWESRNPNLLWHGASRTRMCLQ
jgi:aryl-alcohol dehydrogenase-like predicted oxidoreductase